MEEINRFFLPGQLKAVHVTGDNTSTFHLMEYDVVVTSYPLITAEFLRMARFALEAEAYQQGRSHEVPKKPTASPLSSMFSLQGGPRLGKYLVLDDAHVVNNTETPRFAAISQLREAFDACVMMTGTLLETTWLDSFALLSLLKGHPIASLSIMRSTFSAPPVAASKARAFPVPRKAYLERIIRLLHAVSLQRAPNAVEDRLPRIRILDVGVKLPQPDLDASNNKFREYMGFLDATKNTGVDNKAHDDAKWSALLEAQQHAYHPKLVEIIHIEKESRLRGMAGEEVSDELKDASDRQAVEAWRKTLAERAWKSARTLAVIDTINIHRDLYEDPTHAFIIMDESEYFLDILEIALKNMYEPLPVYRYDGRRNVVDRQLVIQEFSEAQQHHGSCILLASCGTISGLNLQRANVLIQCGPWWKASWIERALRSIYRPGQTKPTFFYRLGASRLSC